MNFFTPPQSIIQETDSECVDTLYTEKNKCLLAVPGGADLLRASFVWQEDLLCLLSAVSPERISLSIPPLGLLLSTQTILNDEYDVERRLMYTI